MKHLLQIVLINLIIAAFLINIKVANSQTAGTLTFNVTPTTHGGGYGAKHNVAIWIENAVGTFVKTKARYANNSHCINNHLLVWKAKSALNVVDATTAATLSSYGALSITWNGTDVNSAIVPDGTYRIYIQNTWDDGSTAFDTTSVTFVKGTSAVNSNPANTTNFTTMSVAWVPNTVSVSELNSTADIKVYPNPTTGLINISFDNIYYGNILKVENILGETVYQENIEQFDAGIKSIDLGRNCNGIYFVTLQNQEKKLRFKILLNR
jgi:hypothetical protein